jgi:hypothetical protein
MKIKNTFLLCLATLTLAACSESSTSSAPQLSSTETAAKSASESTQESDQNNYDELERAALTGDYQAQRNLAYTLTTGIPHNQILGCAWRIVIVESGSDQVDQSDTGNKEFDCDNKLNSDEINAAKAQAKKLQEKIAKK